jgi:hypothetical protein
MTKKSAAELRQNKFLNRACQQVADFEQLLRRFVRNIFKSERPEHQY